LARAGRPFDAPFSTDELAVYDLYRRKQRPQPRLEVSALLVIDATEAFFGPDIPTIEAARLVRTACGAPAWQTIPRVTELLAAFRAAGRPVVYTKPSWRDERHVGGTTSGAVSQQGNDPIMAAIAPRTDEFVIEKAKASAFFGTPLTSYLVRNEVKTIVVAGGATSGCVRATVLDGASYGLDVVIADDACFDRSRLSHSVALFELDVKYAVVLSATDVVRVLRETVGASASAAGATST
jgi:nicotinamidase-related amidase